MDLETFQDEQHHHQDLQQEAEQQQHHHQDLQQEAEQQQHQQDHQQEAEQQQPGQQQHHRDLQQQAEQHSFVDTSKEDFSIDQGNLVGAEEDSQRLIENPIESSPLLSFKTSTEIDSGPILSLDDIAPSTLTTFAKPESIITHIKPEFDNNFSQDSLIVEEEEKQEPKLTRSPNLSAVKDLLIANYSKMSDVLHWKDPIETGIIFGIGATMIIALTFFSIISVFAYSGLGLIAASCSIRAYKIIMKMLNMPSETRFDHTWERALNMNVSLSPDSVHEYIDSSLDNINGGLSYIKAVIMVEDKVATITFGLFLYVLTYLGAWFNGMTLLTLTYIGLFSLPIVYDKNKNKIDVYVNHASRYVRSTVCMLTMKFSSLTSGSTSAIKQD